jgi:hypothetical protein
MFDNLTIRDTRPIAITKRVFQVGVVAYFAIGLTAGYRAFFQIHSLEVTANEQTLHSGSVITTNIVTYARVPVTVRLELIQGAHSEELLTKGIRDNEWAFLDPRPQHASQTVVITPEVLWRFQNGPARVRATGIGRMQLSHTPPPVVREVGVEIQRQ